MVGTDIRRETMEQDLDRMILYVGSCMNPRKFDIYIRNREKEQERREAELTHSQCDKFLQQKEASIANAKTQLAARKSEVKG